MRPAGVYYNPTTRDVVYVGRELDTKDIPVGTVWKKVNVGSFPHHSRVAHLRVNEFTERLEKKSDAEILAIEEEVRAYKVNETVRSDKSDLRAIIKVLTRMGNRTRNQVGLDPIPLNTVLDAVYEELYGIPKVRSQHNPEGE